ncbi:hypothetical protein ON010_g18803 [Phytophthora cinnamomi]|nr:hypothetical protein ON010_g18803 [Phytophthora cinnamomi]
MGTVGGNEMSGMNGTPHYMAPEMFHKHGYYGWAIDLWSLGVVTYVLLFGRFPFDARFLSQVEDKIVKGEFEYPKELESKVSHQAKKFIEYLLVLNPRERPPAAMALQHPWLQVDSSAADPFTDDHMAALAKFSEGKKTFAPPPAREHVPSQPAPPQGAQAPWLPSDDHREPQLHGRLEVEVLQRREHDARQEDARRALEASRVLALGAARAGRVLVLAKGDPYGLRQSVADAGDEDEDEDEVGLRRPGEQPAEKEQHEEPGEDVAGHDPLERVRAWSALGWA